MAAAKAFARTHAATLAAEVREWQDTGLLRAGKLRGLAALLTYAGDDALRIAEHVAVQASLDALIALPRKLLPWQSTPQNNPNHPLIRTIEGVHGDPANGTWQPVTETGVGAPYRVFDVLNQEHVGPKFDRVCDAERHLGSMGGAYAWKLQYEPATPAESNAASVATLLTEDDVFALLGHAEYEQGRGLADIAAFLRELAGRVALARGDAAAAARCQEVAAAATVHADRSAPRASA
jgi:hypothetical protein